MVADVDGDGLDDVIGFEDDAIYVSFSNGRSAPEPKFKLFEHYTPNNGDYTSYNSFPRFFADIDNDGTY